MTSTPSETTPGDKRPLGVAVIGAGWMGHVHARAYARVAHHWPELPLRPWLAAVADPVPGQLADAVTRYAPRTGYADWRELLADDAVEAVSVTVPNSLHREVGVAVAEAGKHLWIEKPVGLTAADARAVADAVAAAGVQGAVGFNYRQVPAVARARALLTAGTIGTVTHARFRMLADYAADPAGSLSWRYQAAQGGSGVLGDLSVHAVDLVRFLLGDLAEVVADTETFIRERPLASAGASQYDRVEGGPTGPVENLDYVAFLGRTTARTPVFLEASRVAVGKQNDYGFEVHGTRGVISWDFRRPGELSVSAGGDYSDQPTTVALSRPGDGDFARFQPGSGNATSFDDTKVSEAAAFLTGIVTGAPTGATLTDAVAAATVVEAVARSARDHAWVAVG